MLASDLIEKLEKLISEHDDLPITFHDGAGSRIAASVKAYDEDGNYFKAPVEFHIG